MEITREFLQNQIAGLQQELGNMLEQASQLRGAIGTCEMLIERLEILEIKEEETEGLGILREEASSSEE